MSHTVIVGSGVAAAALAQSLLAIDSQASILMLEAGPRVQMKDFGLWQNYLVTGQLPYDPYKDLQYPQNDLPGENMSVGGTDVPLAGARVMTLGGSTIHWGGWSFRLKSEDFRLQTLTGNGADWPIDYGVLEPYYTEAERYLGVSGDSNDKTVQRSGNYPFPPFPFTLEDQPIARALDSLKIPYSHLPIARHGITDTTSKQAPCQTTGTCKYCPFGARYAATNFLDDLVTWNDYPHFTIRLETIVEEIVMDSKRRAKGVKVRYNRDKTEVIEADRIIVAAGAIESAKLLLRSVSSDWKHGVGNDHDQVGRYFITHPYFIFKGRSHCNDLQLQKEMDFPTLCTRYFDSEREQAAGKFILVNPPDATDPKIVRLMREGKSREQIQTAIKGGQNVMLHGMVEVFGRYHNRILNAVSERNRMGLLQTIIDYTKDHGAAGFDARLAGIQREVETIFRVMDVDLSSKPTVSWRADHAASTCRMGTHPTNSVVDANLKVHEVDNVFVCSNATFPSLGAVNPTLTLTALSLRLSNHLKLLSEGQA